MFLPGAHSVDWEVLEPSSTVLQTAAIPSQLPVRKQAAGFRLQALGFAESLRDVFLPQASRL